MEASQIPAYDYGDTFMTNDYNNNNSSPGYMDFPNRSTVRVVVEKEGFVPTYAHVLDAGADVKSTQETLIRPGKIEAVGTGVRMEVPEGYVALVCPRSGLAKKGITISNAPGIVDAGYQGEIKVLLHNVTDAPYLVQEGDRIAQLVLTPILKVPFELVGGFDESSSRGGGGFGSTGK